MKSLLLYVSLSLIISYRDRFKKISEHNYVGNDTLVTSDSSNGSSKDDLQLPVPLENSQLHKSVSTAVHQ